MAAAAPPLNVRAAAAARPALVRFGAAGLALLLVAVAYFVLLYADLADALAKQKRLEGSLRTDLMQVRQAESAYQHDLAELAERRQHQREQNTILPESTEYPAFLSAVQSVANVAGVELEGWAPQDETTEKFFARVPMRLVLFGSYHQIARFFYGVGQLDRIINIENISLTQPKVAGDEVKLRVECLATAFHAVRGPTGDKAP